MKIEVYNFIKLQVQQSSHSFLVEKIVVLMFTIEKNAYLDAYLDHNTLLNSLESACKISREASAIESNPIAEASLEIYTHFRDYSATYYGQDTRRDMRFFL